jgi:MFS family permease
LKLGIAVLGLMSASFLAGVGLFQIPSGLLSMRIGMKNTIIIGTAISSFATLASAVQSDPLSLIVLRFIIGAGIAFMFTPGVSLIASYYPAGREGFGVGVYDAFSLTGGIFAYIGNTIIASQYGWRLALALNAVGGLVVGLAFLAIIPRETIREDFKIHVPKIKNVLLDRWLLTVGISLLGLEFASALVGNFMVFYLSSGLRENPLVSGLIASLLPISGVIASVAFGRIFDQTKKMKPLILCLGILTAFGLAVSALNDLNGSVLSTLIVGFFSSGGFIVCIAASRQLTKHEMEYEVLGVSWAITLSLFGSFFGPIFFSYAVIFVGYESAWIFSSLISLGFFAPLVISWARKYPNPDQVDTPKLG